MLISIQTSTSNFESWSEIPPVLHNVDSWEEAIASAYIVSRQLGCITVRVVSVDASVNKMRMADLVNHVASNSGTFIQAK